VCLSGTDVNLNKFSNLVKFGDTGDIPPDCATNERRFYEDITDDITTTPGSGQSFQRTGKGSLVKDLTWIVAGTSLGEVNVGQNLDKFGGEIDCLDPSCREKGVFVL
jgi:hypothetical protein